MLKLDEHLTIVTLEQARDWLAHDLFEGQRNIRLWHARLLADLMRAGRFRCGSPIEFCAFGGRLYLVDGQHTLTAITLCGQPQPLLVIVREAASLAEVGETYATFGRELPRTPADVFAGLGLAGQLGFTPQQTGVLNGALKLVIADFRKVSVDSNPRLLRDARFIADEMAKWKMAARLFFGAVELASKDLARPLQNRSIAAVALATLGAANSPEIQRKAIEFWEQTAMNDGLRRGDPRKTFADWLLAGRAMADPHEHAAYAASAWNAAYEGRQLDTLRPTSKGKIGLLIRGTRFRSATWSRQPTRKRAAAPTHRGNTAPLPLAAGPSE